MITPSIFAVVATAQSRIAVSGITLAVHSRRLTFFTARKVHLQCAPARKVGPVQKNKTESNLRTTDTSYIGTSYLLASTVFLPLFASIADIYGRHFGLQLSLLFFLVGSAIGTGAMNMSMILVGRGIAGIGAAGLLTVRPLPCRTVVVLLTSALGRLSTCSLAHDLSFLVVFWGHRSFEPSYPTRRRSTRTMSSNQRCFCSMQSVSASGP